MISEKDKKIVAAVFASRGEPKGDKLDGHVISECIESNLTHNKGDILFANKGAYIGYYRQICTIEEYNQCIEDMAFALWIDSECDYKNYAMYIANCKHKGIDTSNKELLKERCDYSLVYTQEMADSHDLPLPEMEFMYKLGYQDDDCLREGYGVGFTQDGEWFVFHNKENKALLQNSSNGVYVFHPIKTPEQIKQDKLNEQVSELTSKYRDHKGSTQGLFAAMQKDGYIVEPK